MQVKLGQKLMARESRVFEFEGHDPFVVWEKNQVVRVAGIFLNDGAPGPDVLLDISEGCTECIPAYAILDYFQPVH